MSDSMWWAFYKGLCHHLGLWKKRTLRYQFTLWQMQNHWPKMCGGCGIRTEKKDRTLDHIIPIEMCVELEMPAMIFDPRNFQMLCLKCNQKKGNKIHSLPEAVQKALEKRRELLLCSTVNT